MKKTLCVVLIALSVVTALLSVSAAAMEAPEARLTEKEAREQIEILLSELNAEDIDTNVQTDRQFRITELDYDKLEKVYFTTPLLLENYSARKTFSDVLSDNFQWRLPLQNGQTATVAVFSETDGKLSFEGLGNWKTFSPEELKKAASEAVGAELSADDFTIAESALYHATFVFFEYDGKEYAVPYFQREEERIENGKIYACSDLFAVMGRVFDESAVKADPEANIGAVPYRQASPVPAIVLIAVGCLLIAIILAVVLKLKKREKALTENADPK